jgi:hypothetical protein
MLLEEMERDGRDTRTVEWDESGPWRFVDYWSWTHEPDLDDFEFC